MAGVIIIGIAAASGRNNKPSEKTNTYNSGTKTAITASGTEKSKIYKIGEAVKLKNYIITVNGIRKSDGNEYNKPHEGYEYFYVNCTLENISEDTQTISSLAMFQLESNNGIEYEQSLTVNGDGQLDGNLSAGHKMTGEFVAEVPKGQMELNFIFDSCNSGEKVIYRLN